MYELTPNELNLFSADLSAALTKIALNLPMQATVTAPPAAPQARQQPSRSAQQTVRNSTPGSGAASRVSVPSMPSTTATAKQAAALELATTNAITPSMFTALYKLAEVDDAAAKDALKQLRRLERSAPTKGDIASGAVIGGTVIPAASMLQAGIAGDPMFGQGAANAAKELKALKASGKGGKWGARGRLALAVGRNLGSRAVGGAFFGGAFPAISSTAKEELQRAKLREIIKENTASSEKTAGSKLRKAFKLVEHAHPDGGAQYVGVLHGERIGEINVAPDGHVTWSGIGNKFRGMGLGKKMYGEVMRRQPNQQLGSGRLMSRHSRRVWDGMKARGYKVHEPKLKRLEHSLQGTAIDGDDYRTASAPQYVAELPPAAALPSGVRENANAQSRMPPMSQAVGRDRAAGGGLVIPLLGAIGGLAVSRANKEEEPEKKIAALANSEPGQPPKLAPDTREALAITGPGALVVAPVLGAQGLRDLQGLSLTGGSPRKAGESVLAYARKNPGKMARGAGLVAASALLGGVGGLALDRAIRNDASPLWQKKGSVGGALRQAARYTPPPKFSPGLQAADKLRTLAQKRQVAQDLSGGTGELLRESPLGRAGLAPEMAHQLLSQAPTPAIGIARGLEKYTPKATLQTKLLDQMSAGQSARGALRGASDAELDGALGALGAPTLAKGAFKTASALYCQQPFNALSKRATVSQAVHQQIERELHDDPGLVDQAAGAVSQGISGLADRAQRILGKLQVRPNKSGLSRAVLDETLPAEIAQELPKLGGVVGRLGAVADDAVRWAGYGAQKGLRSGAAVGAGLGAAGGAGSALMEGEGVGTALGRGAVGAAGGAALGAGVGHAGSRVRMGLNSGMGLRQAAGTAAQDIGATARHVGKSVQRAVRRPPTSNPLNSSEVMRQGAAAAAAKPKGMSPTELKAYYEQRSNLDKARAAAGDYAAPASRSTGMSTFAEGSRGAQAAATSGVRPRHGTPFDSTMRAAMPKMSAAWGSLTEKLSAKLRKESYGYSAYGGNAAENPPGMRSASGVPSFNAPPIAVKSAARKEKPVTTLDDVARDLAIGAPFGAFVGGVKGLAHNAPGTGALVGAPIGAAMWAMISHLGRVNEANERERARENQQDRKLMRALALKKAAGVARELSFAHQNADWAGADEALGGMPRAGMGGFVTQHPELAALMHAKAQTPEHAMLPSNALGIGLRSGRTVRSDDLRGKVANAVYGATMGKLAFSTSQYSGRLSDGSFPMRSGIPGFVAPAVERAQTGGRVKGWMVGKNADAEPEKVAFAGELVGLIGGYSPGRNVAGEVAAALAPKGRKTRTENAARQAAVVGAPLGGVAGLMLARKYGLKPKVLRALAKHAPGGLLGDVPTDQQVVGFAAPLVSAVLGSMGGGALTGTVMGGGAQLLGEKRAALGAANASHGPKGRLSITQRVGSPKVTAPSGPSIADVAKPEGFGVKAPGAKKNRI